MKTAATTYGAISLSLVLAASGDERARPTD